MIKNDFSSQLNFYLEIQTGIRAFESSSENGDSSIFTFQEWNLDLTSVKETQLYIFFTFDHRRSEY